MSKAQSMAARLPFDVRFLGFGLVFAWNTLVFGTDIVAAPGLSLALYPGGNNAALVASLAAPIALVACLLFGRKKELIAIKALIPISSLAASLGTILLFVSGFLPGALHEWMRIAAALAAGAAPVVLQVLWTQPLGDLPEEELEIVVPASFAMTLLSVPIAFSLYSYAAVVFGALLPLASGFCLYRVQESAADAGPVTSPAYQPSRRGENDGGSAVLGRAVAALFVVYALDAASAGLPSIQYGYWAWIQLVSCVLAVLAAAAAVVFAVRIDFSSLFRWAAIPFAFGIALSACPSSSVQIAASILENVAVTAFEAIMVFCFIRYASAFGRTYTFCFSLGSLASYGGMLLGYVTLPLVAGWSANPEIGPYGAALVLVVCLVVAVVLSLAQSVPAASLLATSTGHGDTLPDGACRSEGDIALEKVSDYYGLTSREAEILSFLAQGRTQPYIRDALMVSRNTISTHVKHIYSKMEIHSKQELIDIVESFRS